MGSGGLTINLHNKLEEIECEWLNLQNDGWCTFFQSYEWAKAWQDTTGVAHGVDPKIICAKDTSGKTVFILPFMVSKQAGCKVLTWHGTSELTYGMGLFDREFLQHNPNCIENSWDEILDLLENIDLINLEKQPDELDGVNNPLSFLFTTRGANQSYRMDVHSDYEALYAQKRSSSSRRSARKRDKKLYDAGDVQFGLSQFGSDTGQLIDTMIDHQRIRLGKRGIHEIYDDDRLAFLQELALARGQDGQPVFLPYHLKFNDEIYAVMLGGRFQSTYWAMISSLTPDPKHYSLSPGDLALRLTIQDVCNNQYKNFDFAAGDTKYKQNWADGSVSLFESISAVTLKGSLMTMAAKSITTVKRAIKQSPKLFSLAQNVRKFFLKKD